MLRKVIESISTVDIILIVSGISLRSIETAKSIKKSAKKCSNYRKIGVIVNRVKGDITIILDELNQYDLSLFALIPEDELITKFDLEGRALVKIPEDSISFQKITDNFGELLKI